MVVNGCYQLVFPKIFGNLNKYKWALSSLDFLVNPKCLPLDVPLSYLFGLNNNSKNLNEYYYINFQ